MANLTHPKALGEVPAWAARQWGRRTALIFRKRPWSFTALRERVSAMAIRLEELGVGPGQHIAIHMSNRPEYLLAYFAVPAVGARLVPLNTFLAPAEIGAVLRDSGCAALITTLDTLPRLTPAVKSLPALRKVLLCGPDAPATRDLPAGLEIVPWGDLLSPSGPPVSPGPEPDALRRDPAETAVLIYTSGTTGAPKGVMLSHRNLLANAEACIEAVGATPRDRVVLFLPMFHSFTQMVCMLSPVLAGMTIVMCEKLDRAEIKRAILRHRPTIFAGVPAVFAAMSQARLSALARRFNPVRLYISGGAPLSLETLERFETLYRRPLCEGYGLTEASPVVAINPPAGPRKPGSVGIPLPGVTVRIAQGQRQLPAGETGELLVRSPGVMQGYYGRVRETEETLAGGWLHTGDMARLDDDGYIFIMGRSKEMLIYRGLNVYPREIEDVLERHPMVKEAAVIGCADPLRGEVPYAFVVPRPGASPTPSELRRACLTSLARYKVPRVFRIVDELPRNPTGKVLKQTLQQEAALHPSG